VGVQEYSMDANPIKTHKDPVRQTLVKCVFLCQLLWLKTKPYHIHESTPIFLSCLCGPNF